MLDDFVFRFGKWMCSSLSTLQRKSNFMYFLFWELRGHSPNFHIHVSVSDLYIFPGSVHIFSCNRVDRSIVRINKSFTDTWIWKLGLWPRNSFSGNICFKFSVLVLCSAGTSTFFAESPLSYAEVSISCWPAKGLPKADTAMEGVMDYYWHFPQTIHLFLLGLGVELAPGFYVGRIVQGKLL